MHKQNELPPRLLNDPDQYGVLSKAVRNFQETKDALLKEAKLIRRDGEASWVASFWINQKRLPSEVLPYEVNKNRQYHFCLAASMLAEEELKNSTKIILEGVNVMATASRITVPIEARDLVSGTLRRMQRGLRTTQDDVGGLRRAADRMGQDFVSSARRAGNSARDLGAKVGQAADETRQLGRTVVGDLFRRARSGAETFRRTVSRAGSEVKGIPDAHVRLHADDQISPLIDNISAKISGLAALGGGLVLGGGMSDAVFGGVGDYYQESARLAPYLSDQQRTDVLATNERLVAQGLISDKATGASELSTLVPMVQDKSKVSEAFTATTMLQNVIPDSGSEEIQRAVTQTAKNFNESYIQVADSMAHAYKSVGDPQKDLADTFWEYSPYFASRGTSSAQMSNFYQNGPRRGL